MHSYVFLVKEINELVSSTVIQNVKKCVSGHFREPVVTRKTPETGTHTRKNPHERG
jgi:hypothetical protein